MNETTSEPPAAELIAHEGARAAHTLLGLRALVDEMAEQGVAAKAVLHGTGLAPDGLGDARATISHTQKCRVFGNVLRLTRRPDVGLRAGARQRLSDFGVYGYALACNNTFGEALGVGMKHVKLAGPVLEKRFRVEDGLGKFEGRDTMALGPLLPLATEFWFSSILRLIELGIEAPFRSRRLLLPYARPAHAEAYGRVFGCPVAFDAGVLEWHFDAAVLQQRLPNANPITARLCTQFCERMLAQLPDDSDLVLSIRSARLNSRGHFPNAVDMAATLGLSVRTLHRRLAEAGQSYQSILDEIRCKLAVELLQSTSLSVEEIATRVGFSEPSNFRKAFRRWTGQAPAALRQQAAADASAA